MYFVAYACSYVFIILENSRSDHISPKESDYSTNGLGTWMVRRLGLDAAEKTLLLLEIDIIHPVQSDSTTGTTKIYLPINTGKCTYKFTKNKRLRLTI